jgi:hypothetical protein
MHVYWQQPPPEPLSTVQQQSIPMLLNAFPHPEAQLNGCVTSAQMGLLQFA